MQEPLTITQLDATATKWIEREAQRTGLPVEAVVRQLIYRGLEVERQKARLQRHHDLDALAGTWSADEADEFSQAIGDLNQVDPALKPAAASFRQGWHEAQQGDTYPITTLWDDIDVE